MSVANRFSMPGASIEANGGLVTAAAAAFGANGTVGPGGVAGSMKSIASPGWSQHKAKDPGAV